MRNITRTVLFQAISKVVCHPYVEVQTVLALQNIDVSHFAPRLRVVARPAFAPPGFGAAARPQYGSASQPFSLSFKGWLAEP